MYYYGSFWSKCNPPVCAFCECLKVALLKHEFKPSKVVFSHNHDCSKENKLCQERDRIRSEDCGFGFWSWDSGQALGWKGISMNPWISIPKKLQKSEAFVRTFSWQLPERFMEFGIRSVLRMSLFKVCNIIQEWHHRFIYIVETEKKMPQMTDITRPHDQDLLFNLIQRQSRAALLNLVANQGNEAMKCWIMDLITCRLPAAKGGPDKSNWKIGKLS